MSDHYVVDYAGATVARIARKVHESKASCKSQCPLCISKSGTANTNIIADRGPLGALLSAQGATGAECSRPLNQARLAPTWIAMAPRPGTVAVKDPPETVILKYSVSPRYARKAQNDLR